MLVVMRSDRSPPRTDRELGGTHSRQGTPADDGAAAGQARARAAEVMSGIRSSRQARQWSARMEGGRYSLSVAAISSLPDHFKPVAK